MKRPKPSAFFRRPEWRGSFMEGATAYAPLRWIVPIGLLSGLVLAPLGLPVWFAVNCLFTDRFHWPVDLSECRALPAFDAYEWALALAWLGAAGLGYVLLHRASIRRGWFVRLGPAPLHPGHLFAALAAVATGLVLAVALTDAAVTRSERLVVVVTGPVWLRVWWSLRLAAYSLAADRAPAAACAWTLRLVLARQFDLPNPGIATVDARPASNRPGTALPARLVVEGPFDAVDARRIADLINTRFHPVADGVEVRTTLSEEEYWLPYEEELGPSGYESPPIPPPVTVPEPLLWSGAALAALLYGFMLIVGALAPGDGLALREAALSIGRDLEQMEAGLDPEKETGLDTSFYFINLPESRKACPALGRDSMARWRLREERFDDPYVYRVHQVSEVDFFGFEIHSGTRTCVREEPGRNLREAQYRIASRVAAYEWVEIEAGKDWRYVPPREDPRF